MNEEIKKEDVSQIKVDMVHEKKKINPFLFVGDALVDIKTYVVYDDDGQIVSVLNEDVATLKDVLVSFNFKEYVFKFSQVNYDKLNKYRQRSLEYDKMTKNNIVNHLKIRDYFIIYHLRDWNIDDENGKKVELKFDTNGSLSDESVEKVYSLHPSIIDVVLTSFERKMVLV